MGRAVFVAANEAQAQMVCDLLAARGIDVHPSGAWRAALRGMLPMTETSITIEVGDDEDADRALAALAELDDAEPSNEVWACPRCDEEVPSGFAVCWKCGATSEDPLAGARRLGDRGAPLLPDAVGQLAELADEPPANERSLRDLFWAVGAGCVPVALTDVWFSRHRSLFEWLTPSGRVGLVNLMVGVELAACLWLLRRRGVRLSASWGDGQRRLGDVVAGLVLGALLFAVESVVYKGLRHLGAPLPSHTRPAVGAAPLAASLLDATMLLLPGVALASAAGALLLYGVVLARLRTLLRSPVLAVILASLFATLTWCPTGGIALFVAGFATQLLLCGAFLLIGRAWPLALSTFVGYLLMWLPPLLRR